MLQQPSMAGEPLATTAALEGVMCYSNLARVGSQSNRATKLPTLLSGGITERESMAKSLVAHASLTTTPPSSLYLSEFSRAHDEMGVGDARIGCLPKFDSKIAKL